MAGFVYVHNVTGQVLEFVLNGSRAGNVAGWGPRGEEQYRFAAPLALARVPNARDAKGRFANGANQLVLRWPDVTARATVTIDASQNQITSDLVLLASPTRWYLVNGKGNEIASGATEPSWD